MRCPPGVREASVKRLSPVREASAKKLVQGRNRDPVRTEPRQAAAMARKQTRFAAALKGQTPPRTSDLYGWLRSKHREVAALINRRTRDWTKIATEVAAEGVVGANGRPASPDALRKMWTRVDRDVMREQAERLARRAAQKSPDRPPRHSGGKHEVASTTHRAPTPVRAPEPAHHPPPTRSPSGTAPRALAPAPKSKLRLEDLPPEARAEFEKLDRGLADFDRKRFG